MNSHVLFIAILLFDLALAGVSTSDTTPANVEESGRPQVETTRIDIDRLGRIDELVEAAIANDELPGAVVLVGTRSGVVYQRAFGNRAVESEVEPMSLDTVFDLASLTKVVATTTSVMMLVEEGRIRLADRVEAHLPGFGRLGKGGITVGHLLTHMSGLRPDVDLADPWVGYDTAISLALDEVPTSAPGERFVYSDINFFLLGEIVARISGLALGSVRGRAHLRAARHGGHGVQSSGCLSSRGSRRPSDARSTGGRATRQMLRCCGARCTIPRRDACKVSPGTPVCSVRPRTWPCSAGCCWPVGYMTTSACCRP